MKEEGRKGDSPEPTFLPKEVSHLLIKGGRRGDLLHSGAASERGAQNRLTNDIL